MELSVILQKWKNSVLWILSLSLAFSGAVAIYASAYQVPYYRSELTFYAVPAGEDETDLRPEEAIRILRNDLNAVLRSQSFRQSVLQRVSSDGKTYISLENRDDSHVFTLVAVGPSLSMTCNLLNAVGNELAVQAQALFCNGNAGVQDEATLPLAPCNPSVFLQAGVVFLGCFLLLSLLFMGIGSSRRPLRFGDDCGYPVLGAVPPLEKVRKNFRRFGGSVPSLVSNASILTADQFSKLSLRLLSEEARSITVSPVDENTDDAVFTALLAEIFALQGRKVLVLAPESRKEELCDLFRADMPDELSEAIRWNLDADSVPSPTFHPLLSYTWYKQGNFMLQRNFSSFLQDCAKTQDIVLILTDSLPCTAASGFSLYADAQLLLLQDGKTDFAELAEDAKSFPEETDPYIRCVFTRVSTSGFSNQ